MDENPFFKRLERIRDLPTLPIILDKLRQGIRNPNADANHIARIIEDDPAMMARVLKVVNSALYGVDGEITSLQLAVARMGFNAVNNIAMSTSVFAMFSPESQTDFDRMEFWRHSISTGIATVAIYKAARKNLAKRYDQDFLHLIGLLHDIGKIVLDSYFHNEFMTCIQTSREKKIPLFKAEREVIGTDHTEIGAWLGAKWKLGEEVCEVIRWHHYPMQSREDLREILLLCHLANYICNFRMIGNSGDSSAPEFIPNVLTLLGIQETEYYAILDTIVEESRKSEILLSFM